jgi:hypothetical protein
VTVGLRDVEIMMNAMYNNQAFVIMNKMEISIAHMWLDVDLK